MIIRQARIEDSPGIALIHVSTWQHAYRGIVTQGYLDQLSVASREKSWAEIFERQSSETLVADASGQMVGFISFGHSRNTPPVPEEAEVYALYVAPSFWSMGVGRSLCEAALARLRELDLARAIVWVLAANERAIRFYERIGFSLSASSETAVEIGGQKLPELRYEIAIAQEPSTFGRPPDCASRHGRSS